MIEDDFPDKVTKVNINSLLRRAEKIKGKSLQARYPLVLLFLCIVPTILAGFGSFFLMFWLAFAGYFDFLVIFPSNTAITLFFLLTFFVLIVVVVITAVLIMFVAMWLMESRLGFPKDEERIFAECFVIAKHLIDGERLMAKREVYTLFSNFKGFTRHLFFNPRRRVYSPEFDLFRSGKAEVCRMIMFSTKNVAELFMNFGLAMLRNDDPTAYSTIKQLEDIVKEYGEPKGRFHRFLSGIEKYPHTSPLVLSIMIMIIAVIYFFLSGQSLPLKL